MIGAIQTGSMMMKVIRSWPPEQWMIDNHPYIVDNSTRITLTSTKDYIDYWPLIQVNDDFIHMDWDIAIGRDELRAFAARCQEKPDKMRAGPYRTYPHRRYRRGIDPDKRTRWHAWHTWKATSRVPEDEVKPGDPTCKFFGMGFVYVPFYVWKGYIADCEKRNLSFASCRGLSRWYHANVAETIDLDWNVNLVHVNYSIQDALDLDY
jgi:hypothetical protein